MLLMSLKGKYQICVVELPQHDCVGEEMEYWHHCFLSLVQQGQSDSVTMLQQLHFNNAGKKLVPMVLDGALRESYMANLPFEPCYEGEKESVFALWHEFLKFALSVKNQSISFGYDKDAPESTHCRTGVIATLKKFNLSVSDQFYKSVGGTQSKGIQIGRVVAVNEINPIDLPIVQRQITQLKLQMPHPKQQN